MAPTARTAVCPQSLLLTPILSPTCNTHKNTNWRNGLFLPMREAIFSPFIVTDLPYRTDWEVSQCTLLLWQRCLTSFIFIFTYLALSGCQVANLLSSSSRVERTRYKCLGWWQRAIADLAHSPLTQPWHLLTHRWSDLRESAAGWKGVRQKEGQSGWMGDVPSGEIMQIFPVKTLWNPGSCSPLHQASKCLKNALSSTILLETFILSLGLPGATDLFPSWRAAIAWNMLQSIEVMKFMAGIENGWHIHYALPSADWPHADSLNWFLLWLSNFM